MRIIEYSAVLLAGIPIALVRAAAQTCSPASLQPPATCPADTPPPALDRPGGPDEPLVTDRPDFTESTEAVPAGRFQLEGGYTFTLNNRPRRSRSHTAPEMLLRAGLFENVELRLGWEGYTWLNEQVPDRSRASRRIVRTEQSQGGSDLYLGFKHKLFEQDALRPHLGLIPAVTLPGGSTGNSSGDVDPEFKLAWAYDLAEGLSLAGNFNLGVPTDEGRRFVQSAASVSLAFDVLENAGLYVEYFGFYPAATDAGAAHTFNGGLTWRITERFQIDWRAGIGLNDEAEDFFTGVGFAVRW